MLKYLVVSTLAESPICSPVVKEWYVGSSQEVRTIRFQVFVWDDQQNKGIRRELPGDCMYVVESAVVDLSPAGGSNGGNPFDDLYPGKDGSLVLECFKAFPCPEGACALPAPGDNEWIKVGKCRSGVLNVIVPVGGCWDPIIYVRVRISNQDNQLSDPSPVFVFKLKNDLPE